MGVCESGCHFYNNNGDVNITPVDYKRCSVPKPYPLGISITRTSEGRDIIYAITMGNDFNNKFTFKVVLFEGELDIVDTVDRPNGVGISNPVVNRSTGSITVYLELISPNSLLKNSYILGDQYHINIVDARCLGAASAQYIRSSYGQISNDSNSMTISSNLSLNTVKLNNEVSMNIPQIHFQAQTTINASDIGDAVFTIYDEFTYYDKHRIPDNTCKLRENADIKTTIFRECCPSMVSVVKGKGITLWEKLNYLVDKGLTDSPDVYVFYQNMALYGMTKYILSRLLYGEFNIKYLLARYNDKFLKDLSTSRFCAFMKFFDTYDYNKYFLLKFHHK